MSRLMIIIQYKVIDFISIMSYLRSSFISGAEKNAASCVFIGTIQMGIFPLYISFKHQHKRHNRGLFVFIPFTWLIDDFFFFHTYPLLGEKVFKVFGELFFFIQYLPHGYIYIIMINWSIHVIIIEWKKNSAQDFSLLPDV